MITRGYFDALGWMVIQTALCLKQLLPQTTREIAEELDNDVNFNFIIAAGAMK